MKIFSSWYNAIEESIKEVHNKLNSLEFNLLSSSD